MLMEGDLRSAVTAAAQGLIRGRLVPKEAVDVLEREADHLDARLTSTPFLGGERPMASDIWLYPAPRWIGQRVGITTEQAEKMKALEREVRELKQANEILRKASAYFAPALIAASGDCRAVGRSSTAH